VYVNDGLLFVCLFVRLLFLCLGGLGAVGILVSGGREGGREGGIYVTRIDGRL